MSTPRSIAVAAVVAVALALPAAAAAKPVITLSGSTSVAPLASKLAKAYVKKQGKVKFKILQGGSDLGVSDVAHGRVTLGMSSRDPQASDPGGLDLQPHRPRRHLHRDQSRQPDREPLAGVGPGRSSPGRCASWSQVPGAQATGTIDLIVRNAASGTQDAFQNIFMGQNLRVAPSASQKPSNGRVQQAIALQPERDRLRRLQLHQRPAHGPLQGRRRARCATRSPASTAACATSGW